MELLQGAWKVDLCELTYPKPENGMDLQPVFVYCDVMES